LIPFTKEYSYIYVARPANGKWEAWDHGPGDASFSANRQRKNECFYARTASPSPGICVLLSLVNIKIVDIFVFIANNCIPGQQTLTNSAVLIVGAGGLGCPSSLYLTGAGVGR
jgi:hypothetical protein